MLKHIPNKFTQKMVYDFINSNFGGLFDYFYMPRDKSTRCNNGYAFINMTHPLHVIPFYAKMEGLSWSSVFKSSNSAKASQVQFANWQGKERLSEKHRDRYIQSSDQTKPVILSTVTISEDDILKYQDGVS